MKTAIVKCHLLKIISKNNIRTLFLNASNLTNENGDNKKITSSNVKNLLDESATYEDENPKGEYLWSTSPYPKGADVRRSQAHQSYRPIIDPSETSIITFPGQGSQYVGMNKDVIKFPHARDLFKTASSILNYDLEKLCLNGPADQLDMTEYAQPAIVVCSLAAIERLKEEKPKVIENCVATAGFSVGEISALVFAKALSFEKAVRLVKIRAEAMQSAADMQKGAMAMVRYRPDTNLIEAFHKAENHAESLGIEKPYCRVANYLFPHCKIIAGNEECITFLQENKKELNLNKLKRLQVSGAFHTPLMAPAADVFKEALYKSNISNPIIAVHSNVTGKVYNDFNHIKSLLSKQIVAPVKWEQTLHILYERGESMPYPKTYECGPGNTLNSILRMVNLKAYQECFNIRS